MDDLTWIRFDLKARHDSRIKRLALKLGISHNDALVACIDVWIALYQQGGGYMEPDAIDAASGVDGFAEKLLVCNLAEAHKSGLRIKGDFRVDRAAELIAKQSELSRNATEKRHALVRDLPSGLPPSLTNDMSDASVVGQLQHDCVTCKTKGHIARCLCPMSLSLDPTVTPSVEDTALLAAEATPQGERVPSKRAKQARPPKPPRDELALATRSCSDFWSNLWSSVQGGPYNWTKEQEIHALRPVVKKLGPGETQKRMRLMIVDPPASVRSFLKGQPPTIGAFISCINSLAPWSESKAKVVATDAASQVDDLHRDENWRRKSGLRFAELNALANRKVPAWWADVDRIAMTQDAHGDPVIPLAVDGVPKQHSHVVKRLRQFIEADNRDPKNRAPRNAEEVVAWYVRRFQVKEVT